MLVIYLSYKLKNKLIYIVFINTNIKVLYLYSLNTCFLIYFYLIILLNIRKRTNKAKSLLTFIKVKVIIINI
jgi:hypothetical protein